MSYVDPEMARQTLAGLLNRCTATNSTIQFRAALMQAMGALDRNELSNAATIIGDTCSHVADLHDCVALKCDAEWPHPLQADEAATEAYCTLDKLRYDFGYLYLRRLGTDVTLYS